MILPPRLILLLLLLSVSGVISYRPTIGGGLIGQEILFSDDFSDTSTGWDRFENDILSTNYADDVYRIEINDESIIAWGVPYVDFTDVIIEVEAYKASGGDDNGYGIVCRHQDANNFYVLEISSDGYAWIGKRYNSDFIGLESTSTDVVNLGGGTNYLHAECIGDRLSLYVNGILVIEAFDSDIIHGDVGLVAETYSANSTEIIFDNFIVFAP